MVWTFAHLFRYASLAFLAAGIAAIGWYGIAHLFHRPASVRWVSGSIRLVAASFLLLAISIGIASMFA